MEPEQNSFGKRVDRHAVVMKELKEIRSVDNPVVRSGLRQYATCYRGWSSGCWLVCGVASLNGATDPRATYTSIHLFFRMRASGFRPWMSDTRANTPERVGSP